MSVTHVIELIERDLDRLKQNIQAYKDEQSIWKNEGHIKNSGGNLCLHICGNIQHYLGNIIMDNGYVRDRDYEFQGGPETAEALCIRIDATIKVIRSLEAFLTPDIIDKEYPLEVLGYKMTTGYFLVHLYGHLNYHLGQINYHRRLLEGEIVS